tara:strand:- start:330 stop:611 length:282 start_codon:yes stop_codon:yes gene_type:complete
LEKIKDTMVDSRNTDVSIPRNKGIKKGRSNFSKDTCKFFLHEGFLIEIKLYNRRKLNPKMQEMRRSYMPIISAIVPPESPGMIFANPIKIPLR